MQNPVEKCSPRTLAPDSLRIAAASVLSRPPDINPTPKGRRVPSFWISFMARLRGSVTHPHEQMHLPVLLPVADVLVPRRAAPGRQVEEYHPVVRDDLEDLARGHHADPLRGPDDRDGTVEPHRVD